MVMAVSGICGLYEIVGLGVYSIGVPPNSLRWKVPRAGWGIQHFPQGFVAPKHEAYRAAVFETVVLMLGLYTQIYIYIYIYIIRITYTHMYVYIYICIPIYMCIYVYAHSALTGHLEPEGVGWKFPEVGTCRVRGVGSQ